MASQHPTAARDAWIARWPNYCTTCEGYGAVSWTEFHDGPLYPGEIMQEPCGCVETGHCPRCASPNLPDSGVCPSCEWDAEFPNGCPPPEFEEPANDE